MTRKRVCDICESDEGVTRYRITRLEGTRQQTATVDICSVNPHTIQEAVEAATLLRRGRKAGRPVVSLDEVTAKKTATASRRKQSDLATRVPKDESQQASKKAPARKAGVPRKRG